MKIQLLVFGVAQDIIGGREVELVLPGKTTTVGELKNNLLQQYPDLAQLVSFLIAVNSAYADNDTVVKGADEVAVIPPTSGG
jgi:molybdopterin synthase sulfur carrier subunit